MCNQEFLFRRVGFVKPLVHVFTKLVKLGVFFLLNGLELFDLPGGKDRTKLLKDLCTLHCQICFYAGNFCCLGADGSLVCTP